MHPGLVKSTGLVFDSERSLVEPPATVLHDKSRFKNHGTITGATWIRLPSGLWYLAFDATDDVSKSFDMVFPSLTFELWYKGKPNDTARQFLIQLTHPITPGRRNCIQVAQSDEAWGELPANTLAFQSNTSGRHVKVTWDEAWSDRWIWIAATCVGSVCELFVNGNSVASEDIISREESHNSYIIGSITLGGIALPRIYRHALSAGQIRKNFEGERHWFGV